MDNQNIDSNYLNNPVECFDDALKILSKETLNNKLADKKVFTGEVICIPIMQ